jgi:hypothetical protein
VHAYRVKQCILYSRNQDSGSGWQRLQQILSLLPSHGVVRTCVLATCLSINSAGEIYRNPQVLSRFANHLLILRDRTPLRECEINSYYAVSCQVQVLRVLVKNELHDLRLSDVSLLTQHLTKLELCSTEVGVHFLDFSCCPALKVLKMEHCPINAARISSQSLSHLIINYGNFISVGHTHISSYFLCPLFLCIFLQG